MSAIIIDYGMGNVASVQNALSFLNVKSIISNNLKDIESAKFIILPGVGAFKQGMDNLRDHNLIQVLNQQVLLEKKPFFGICLGMQLIAQNGNEPIACEGMGWIKGQVRKIVDPDKTIPHLGWNQVTTLKDGIIQEFNQKDFYFIHSYHFDVEDKKQIAATVNYGEDYVAAIQHENIFATQFHPEKSQKEGLKLLQNFFQFYA
jgi:glutamine amidotransferase